jgi:general secretion pathway protein C
MSFGQLVPEHNASGTTLGMRLGALQPGTLPTLLGLESGDRLEAINGYSVSDPEKLLELYARLSSASRVVIDVVRGGHAQSIEYSIR